VTKNTNNTVQAFWIGIGSLSSLFVGVISVGILSRYFDKDDYGTYRQVLYVYNTLLVVFSAGLPGVFSYFLPQYPLTQGKFIVSMITRLLAIMGLMFSLFLFVCSDFMAFILKNPELSYAIKCFSPIPLLILPTLGIEGIFSVYKQAVYVAVYNMITRILMVLCIVLPVVVFNGTYLNAIYGWVVGSVISLFIAFYFKKIPFDKIQPEKTTLSVKMVFQYSLPIVTASIAGIVIKSADQFFVSRYFGSKVFAEYANGFIEIPFIGMITGASATVLMPIFSGIKKDESGVVEIIKTWKNVILKSAIMIYPVVVFCVYNSGEIMMIIYSEKYYNSGMYFRINMMLNFFNIVIFAPLLLSMGKTRLYSAVHVCLAIFIWLSDYIIIILFNDPVAIAINGTAVNIFKILLFIYFISGFLKIRFYELFPLRVIIKILFHSVMAIFLVQMALTMFVVEYPLYIQLIFKMSAYGVMLLTTGSMIGIDYLSPFKPIVRKFSIC
jgi:O-antigen/teichoic acid export membrane protein